jgi:hypothetical protein
MPAMNARYQACRSLAEKCVRVIRTKFSERAYFAPALTAVFDAVEWPRNGPSKVKKKKIILH